ncbi:alanine--glyoxylate aminotransferase family protein [Telmatocola sphagniphila]|uniref:Alanine--glyoxylate aminotransferase family protein n=1 Tax=Telmatocola sphagniphila TaxID=1123043 RepID=A0A8E6ESA0_9BACT|nr:alanine--glyoxylate aminotransferase family protein [Telmatocola sphagniphila]QVL30409.1 alanine--glyoxylate aminotransferase family protein [Telmatocola sphagniphila]
MSLPGQLNIPNRLLLGPGPSDAHPRVLAAMANPLLGHLDPAYLEIMNETAAMLREAFQTKNPLTFPISATGMAGMETCLVNLLEAGDKVIICQAGFFSLRMVEVATRCGAEVTTITKPWGQVFELSEIREALQRIRPKALGIVQAETSTGSWQPIEELGKLCHEFDCLLVVDAVTALGCIPVKVDEWEIDAIYSCSQKGLSCPPGLAPVSFSPRAEATISKRKTKVQSWYLDMTLLKQYWGAERAYHHTAPISMTYALREGLKIVLEEGLENRWARHLKNHTALKAGLIALGLHYTAQDGHQLPQLNAVRIPDGVDDMATRKKLLMEFGIEVGGGLGDFKGKVWRIGLMGYNSKSSSVFTVLAALEQCLRSAGAKVTPGSGVAAAELAYQR